MAAIQSSRRLAYFSTGRNVDRLIYCVRDGYRSDTVAMAARLNITYELDCEKVMYKNVLQDWISPGLD